MVKLSKKQFRLPPNFSSLLTPWRELCMCQAFIQPSDVERRVLHSMEIAGRHEVGLHFSSGCSLSSRIQTDTEIIALTGILMVTSCTIGSNTLCLEQAAWERQYHLKQAKCWVLQQHILYKQSWPKIHSSPEQADK